MAGQKQEGRPPALQPHPAYAEKLAPVEKPLSQAEEDFICHTLSLLARAMAFSNIPVHLRGMPACLTLR